MQLAGVVVVTGLAKKCSRCSLRLEARKMDVRWKKTSDNCFSYLLTDVLYCAKCKIGFYPSLFKSMKDKSETNWAVCETTILPTSSSGSKKTTIAKTKRVSTSNSISSPKTKKQKKENSVKNVFNEECGFLDTGGAAKSSPIMSNGSPRSKQNSTFYNSAGVFKPGTSSRKWDNYWGE